jgi:acetylornithine deacetylase/succinyl-diaminopimelate desuccinylase-like protein
MKNNKKIKLKEYLKLLKEFVAIESVSTDKKYFPEIVKCSKWLFNLFKKSGFETRIYTGFDNPIVVAKTKKDPKKETILVYGHYDVQPAKKSDGWKTNPFEMKVKSGKLFGRGTTDNKGQILIHILGVANLLKENKLKYNVIFLVEGNEESGSDKLPKFVEKYKKELKTDCIIISDGELAKGDSPAIEESFRGVCNIEMTLRTAKDDLHSGLFGGAIPNASEELSKLISKIFKENKEIAVPDFYNKIELKNKTKNNSEIESLKKVALSREVFALNDSDYQNRTGLQPTIEVTGLYSGYTDVGFRNSIPSKAVAKINIRSAPNQDPKKLAKKFIDFLYQNTPSFVELEIKQNESTKGSILDLSNKYCQEVKSILKDVYKKEVNIKNSGGTLPIVNDFNRILGTKQVMVPLANEDCGMHSASENIKVSLIEKGLEFSQRFFGI